LNRSPHYERIIFDLVLVSVSQNVGGWENAFLVDVLMTGSALVENSNCFTASREDPSSTSTSFNFGSLGERLVVGFLGGIFLQKEKS
jgi:hypothetical protein